MDMWVFDRLQTLGQSCFGYCHEPKMPRVTLGVLCDLLISSTLAVRFVCPCYLCFPSSVVEGHSPDFPGKKAGQKVPDRGPIQMNSAKTALAVGEIL